MNKKEMIKEMEKIEKTLEKTEALMVDTEHDSINWGLIVTLLLCVYYWVNVYLFGFFTTTMWTIVLAAMVGLYFRLVGKI